MSKRQEASHLRGLAAEYLINDLSNTAYFQAKNNKGTSNAGAVAGGVLAVVLPMIISN